MTAPRFSARPPGVKTLEELVTRVSALLESGALVTFHDAHKMIRTAKNLGEPRNVVVLGFVALHDENSTDGARSLFSEYLRSAGARLRAQQELAARPILLKDDGKIARTAPGSTVRLELEERRVAGLRWTPRALQGPGQIERAPNVDEAAPRARFALHCTRPGLIRLSLDEVEPDGSIYSHAKSRTPTFDTRTMSLTVIVER